MNTSRTFLRWAFAGLALTLTGTVYAQQGTDIETFTCESQGNSHNECRYNASGNVTVHVNRQLSKSRCVFNDTWGSFDGGVWVDYGCRAEFVVRRPPGERPYRPVGGTLDTVTCESRNNSYTTCPVNGIDPRSVTVERQLSRSGCYQGDTWGVSEGENSPAGIWVDRGCRATFAYRTNGGGGSSWSSWSGTPHDFQTDCISEMSEWRHCNVDQVHLARVELVSGNNQCNDYKAWGTDDTGIWVRNNCMGTFQVRYRH